MSGLTINYTDEHYFSVVIERRSNFRGVRLIEKALSTAALMYGYTCGYQYFVRNSEKMFEPKDVNAVKSLFPCLDDLENINPSELLRRAEECEELKNIVEGSEPPPKYELSLNVIAGIEDIVIKMPKTPFAFGNCSLSMTDDAPPLRSANTPINVIKVYVDMKYSGLDAEHDQITVNFNFLAMNFAVLRAASFPIRGIVDRTFLVESAKMFVEQLEGYEAPVLHVLKLGYEFAYKWFAAAKKLKTLAGLAV